MKTSWAFSGLASIRATKAQGVLMMSSLVGLTLCGTYLV
jgi:hypothetical protein